ncbi:hypothetical protein BURPS305_2847 [Burkholderia pseudomallei 305]|nr:hypothetical protein BURPS305_2847 [Burkholderia pseudomallei 305]
MQAASRGAKPRSHARSGSREVTRRRSHDAARSRGGEAGEAVIRKPRHPRTAQYGVIRAAHVTSVGRRRAPAAPARGVTASPPSRG